LAGQSGTGGRTGPRGRCGAQMCGASCAIGTTRRWAALFLARSKCRQAVWRVKNGGGRRLRGGNGVVERVGRLGQRPRGRKGGREMGRKGRMSAAGGRDLVVSSVGVATWCLLLLSFAPRARALVF